MSAAVSIRLRSIDAMTRTRFFGVASALAMCGSLSLGCGGDDSNAASGGRGRLFDYAQPGPLGQFPIGFVVMPFVDETRPELATLDATDHRTLPSVVWYPAGE